MKRSTRPDFLHRYTSTANVIQLLTTGRITLRSPLHWEDRNDAFALELYRQRVGAKSVAAVCFTQASETYHHWKIFAPRGACIQFDKARLLRVFKGLSGVRLGAVKYREIVRLRHQPPREADLPFLKRHPYRDEREYRVLSIGHAGPEPSFPVPLAAIRRITLSPWLTAEQIENERRAMKAIEGCASLKVYRTTVLENADWKAALRASRAS